MTGLDKVVIHDDAIQELLKSDELLAVLEEHGQAMANAAGDGFAMDSDIGPHRARVAVHSTGIDGELAEARDQALTKAIDAGR